MNAPPRAEETAGSAPITIAPLLRRHLRAVLRIETVVYPKPWTESLFLSELALPASRRYVVARVGRKVVGYAGIMWAPDEAHITTIAVDPAWQRRQVATRLLLALTRAAVERGYAAMTLEVRLGARGAQALYRRFGFTPEGARRDYYSDPVEDAVVMWVRGIDTPEHARLLDTLDARASGALDR